MDSKNKRKKSAKTKVSMRDLYTSRSDCRNANEATRFRQDCCDLLIASIEKYADEEAYYEENTQIINDLDAEKFFGYAGECLAADGTGSNRVNAIVVLLLKYCFSHYSSSEFFAWTIPLRDTVCSCLTRVYSNALHGASPTCFEAADDLELRISDEFAQRTPTPDAQAVYRAYREQTLIGQAFSSRLVSRVAALYGDYRRTHYYEYKKLCLAEIGVIFERYIHLPDDALQEELAVWIANNKGLCHNPRLVMLANNNRQIYSELLERAFETITYEALHHEKCRYSTPASLLETYEKIHKEDPDCEKEENIEILDALCMKITENDCERMLAHTPHLKGLLHRMLIQYSDIVIDNEENPEKVEYLQELARKYKFRFYVSEARYENIEKFMVRGNELDMVIAARLTAYTRIQACADKLEHLMFQAAPIRAFSAALCLCKAGDSLAAEYVSGVLEEVSMPLQGSDKINENVVEHYIQHLALMSELGQWVPDMDDHIFRAVQYAAHQANMREFRARIYHYAVGYFSKRAFAGIEYLLSKSDEYAACILFMIGSDDALCALEKMSGSIDRKHTKLCVYFYQCLRESKTVMGEKQSRQNLTI